VHNVRVVNGSSPAAMLSAALDFVTLTVLIFSNAIIEVSNRLSGLKIWYLDRWVINGVECNTSRDWTDLFNALSKSGCVFQLTYCSLFVCRISTEYDALFGTIGRNGQQLTTATITITPNATNRNLRDIVFIATAVLTPRAAIIKPKVSRWCGHCALTLTQARA
jgi:hypothetical protein